MAAHTVTCVVEFEPPGDLSGGLPWVARGFAGDSTATGGLPGGSDRNSAGAAGDASGPPGVLDRNSAGAASTGAGESPAQAPTLYVRDYAVTDVLCKQSLLWRSFFLSNYGSLVQIYEKKSLARGIFWPQRKVCTSDLGRMCF